MKTVYFSETIVACDLKDGRCRQLHLVEQMKVYGYSRSIPVHGPMSFTSEN